ncbi:hypothetical protein HZA40_00570 [Candidatus Peregrinibacteria bacterium]|nr:hypothetical protein [Candidatus Peregrinibacteria bacterium]
MNMNLKNLIPVAIALVIFGCGSTKPTESTAFKTFCEDKKIEYPKLVKTDRKFTREDHQRDYDNRQQWLAKPTSELFSLLDTNKSLAKNGDTLYLIGLSYTKYYEDDQILKYYECSAEKYFDTKSMLKLAKLKLTTPLAADYNKAYFWILNAIYIDIYQGGKNNIIANGLGLMDELQNVDDYNEKGLDKTKVEKESSEFIEKLYPEEKNLEEGIRSHYQFLLN